ncbi:MAG: rhodanese-like domain-containing protein [Snowella sp.]|nr:rhodanese-like domain-containing protein [Snowella sp.]
MTKVITEITVQELALRLANKDSDLQLIDVREPHEVAIAHLEGFDVLPLSDFANWSETIQTRYQPRNETLVICHHGMRSDRMCQWLRNIGFTNVKNVVGGIDAYAALVDPKVARY